MVPKFYGPRGAEKKKHGTSFKHLASYLLHDDGKAQTSERVGWTHTLNLTEEFPDLAVHEMLWTYRAAEDLKRQAGVKAGGRPLDRPVRHFSLNWHPSERPTKEHMVETVQSFLAHMKWQDHQALIVSHTDKPHSHVHVMLNAVHPMTGLALDNSFEKRRAQEWAREYERDQGLIFCEERLKPASERTPSPTRATWEQLRAYEKEDDRAEQSRQREFDYFVRGDKTDAQDGEWTLLKEYQKNERIQFMARGKQLYLDTRNEAYREVRAEFKMEWRTYYKDKRNGGDKWKLAARKADILKRQRDTLDARRKLATDALRKTRDEEYDAILQQQREHRLELHARQRDGSPSYHLLDRIYPEIQRPMRELEGPPKPLTSAFQRAAREVGERKPEVRSRKLAEPRQGKPRKRRERFKVKNALDIGGGLGLGLVAAVSTIGERLFDGLLGGGEQIEPSHQEAAPDHVAEERRTARSSVAVQSANESQAAEAARLAASWEDRRRRRRERD